MPPASATTPRRAAEPPLAGRTVLVTGGAHRVGGAISRHLGALGARVLVHFHTSAAEAEALVAALPAGGLTLAADLARPDGPADLVAACAAAGELPDAAVHSAASFLRRPVLETTAADWDAVFALNTRAFFLLATELAHRWREEAVGERLTAGEGSGRPPDRCLVAISDAGARELWTGYAAHCVSKAALLPLVKVLAKALSPEVRVNAVVPGPVLPPPRTSHAERQAIAERTLLGEIGEPDAVARAVAYLLSEPFATGAELDVTGGSHLWRGSLDRS